MYYFPILKHGGPSRLLLLLILTVSMLRGLSLAESTGNAIFNSGFENTNVFDQPVGWKAVGCKLASSTETRKSGHRSVVVVGRSGFWSGPRQKIDASDVAGNRFLVSAWVKLGTDTTAERNSPRTSSDTNDTNVLVVDQQTADVVGDVGSGNSSNVSSNPRSYQIQMMAMYKRRGKDHYTVIGKTRAVEREWRQILENHVFPESVSGTVTIYLQGEYGVFPYFDFYVDDVSMRLWKAPTNWREEADRRIRKIRQREVELVLKGIEAKPSKIEVIQQRLRFGLGSVVTSHLINDTVYRKHFLDNFNMATLENGMKWYHNEPQQDKETYEEPDAIMSILEKHNISVRGHTLFWASPRMQQPWVRKLTAEQLQYQMKERIQNVMARYKGRLQHWDVNNEMLHGRFYRDRLQNDSIPVWMFKQARMQDNKAELFLNDYGVITWGDNIEEYKTMADLLINEGCDIGGLGVEGHFPYQNPPDPILLRARLDQLSEANIPIWLTEVDVIDPLPAARAEKLEYVLRTAFSHPGVQGVILWGFWAGNHWAGTQASLWDKDWQINDAGSRLLSLKEEWTTNRMWNGMNIRQHYHFRGYHGSYLVRIRGETVTREANFEIVPGKGRQVVTLDFSATTVSEPAIATLEDTPIQLVDISDKAGPSSDETGQNPYVGCYRDGQRRAMDGYYLTDHNSMTVQKCVNECRKRNFDYAGLEWRYECFCGNSYTMYGARNESWCNRPCTGDSKQICGGGYTLSVYVVVKQSKPIPNEGGDDSNSTTNTTLSGPEGESTTANLLFSNGVSWNETETFAEDSDFSNKTSNGYIPEDSLFEDDPRSKISSETVNNSEVTYIGCFPDNDPPRALNGRQRYVTPRMTPSVCIEHCSGFRYAGLQHSMECYCGNQYDRYGSIQADQWKCNSPCAGNGSQICGGIMHNSVYRRGHYWRETLTIGTYLGCWQDALPKRTLQGSILTSDSMTIERCLTFCVNNGYIYGGLQYGVECFCGNHYRSRQLAEINCNERCAGEANHFCGGTLANSVFYVQDFSNQTIVQPSSTKAQDFDLKTTQFQQDEGKATYKTPPPPPLPMDLTKNNFNIPERGSYIGCYEDMDPHRAMNRTQRYVSSEMTIELCIEHCLKFRYAGLQYGTECFCSDNYDKYGKTNHCWAKCTGNSSQECGGSMANSVYSTGQPGGIGFREGSYLGCWLDDSPSGILEGSSIRISNMTVDVCLAFCRIEGYNFAGLQKGQECYCGNMYRTILQAESFCYLPCSGNSQTMCGGHSRNSVFSVTGNI